MSVEERIKALLCATPEQLAGIDAALAGKPERPTNLRLLKICQAADVSGLSRFTIWRLLREGALPAVEIRKGSRRIPEAALRAFIEGRTTARTA